MNRKGMGLGAFAICFVLVASACTSTENKEDQPTGGGTAKSDEIDRTSTTIPLSRKPPNILIIQTDDQRSTGTLVAMPTTRRIFLDKGTRYTNAVATTPVCCPSRTSLLTGQYAHNHGVIDNLDGNPLQERQGQTLQAALQRAGYQTAIAGKLLNSWPIGIAPEYFSRWAILGGDYYDALFDVDGTVIPVAAHSTDFISDMASEFLDDFEEEDDRPWFVHINTFSPHVPYTTQPRHEDAPIPPWNPNPAVGEPDLRDKPQFIQETSKFTAARGEDVRAQQLRSLMSVDDLVRQVFSKLKKLDETRDTLAFYVSDHGYLWGEHGRLWKRAPYVKSTDIPLLVRWPGHFPVESREGLVANIDLAPTILEAAGIDPPKNWDIDGNSLLDGKARSEVLLEYWKEPDTGFPSWAALRTQDWIYVEYLTNDQRGVTSDRPQNRGVTSDRPQNRGVTSDRPQSKQIIAREYYDLQTDPFQLTNLLQDGIEDNDPDVDQLHQRLVQAMKCRADNCPE